MNTTVVEEKPVTLAELKEYLSKKSKEELTTKAEKTLGYLRGLPITKNPQEIKEKLIALDIPRLKKKHIAKLIDIMPKDMDTLRATIAHEISLKQEDMDKILNVLKSY